VEKGWGEPGLFRSPIEQLLAQSVFEAADGLTDCGLLRSAKPLGRARESFARERSSFTSSGGAGRADNRKRAPQIQQDGKKESKFARDKPDHR